MNYELNKDYHLSTEGFHFRYREDKYNPETIRAELFNSKNEKIDAIIVKGGVINADFSHFDIINTFETSVGSLDFCPQECIGCSKEFDIEGMEQDNAGEYYCAECWTVLSPIMKTEYDELKANGEID